MLQKILSCLNRNKKTVQAIPVHEYKQKINTITGGMWKVSYYFDNISDETSKFNNFNFTFHVDGKVTVHNTLGSHEGKWELSTFGKRLRISLPNCEPLADLDDIWVIENHTSNEIILTDDKIQSFEKLQFSRKYTA